MRKYVIAAAVAGVLVVSMSTPAFGLPRSFVDDPDDFMNYWTTESTSNCGGNTACDIAWSSFVVSKSSPDSVVVLAGMTGRTYPEMSNSEKGGLYFFVDSDTDASDWEYVPWTR